MYGFGRGTAWGRGIAGRGAGRCAAPQRGPQAPAGYSYLGPCRCGFGPNAYYQDASGRILPAGAAFSAAAAPLSPPEGDLEALRAEKADLDRRLRDLEGQVKGTQ